jgi:hypothetical protein
MISSTGVFVKRNLSTNPIGTASVTANSPLGATGSTIGVLPASSLAQLTNENTATADKFLIWDESASSYKYITAVDVADYVINSGATAVPTVFIAKPQAAVVLGTANTFIPFAEVSNEPSTGATSPATSCVSLGGASDYMSLVDSTGIRDNIRILSQGMYKLEASVEYTISSGTPDISTQIFLNDGVDSAILMRDLEATKAGFHTITLVYYFYADSGVPYDIGLRCSSTSAATLGLQSSFTITRLGDVV